MPRLRETNPKLDNQLKSINRKILAAARVSTDSETYRKLAAQVKMIAATTKQDKLATKTVNGKAIPQLSRANSYYAGLKAANSMQVQSIAAQAQRESITAEMQKFAQSSGKGFAKTKAFKEDFKNVLAQQAFQKKKDQLLSGDSGVADLLRDVPAGTKVGSVTEQWEEYMLGEYYNVQGNANFMDKVWEALDEDIQTYSSKIDDLKRDIEAETDNEKLQALQDLLGEAENTLELLESKKEDLADVAGDFLLRDSYKGVISKYFS